MEQMTSVIASRINSNSLSWKFQADHVLDIEVSGTELDGKLQTISDRTEEFPYLRQSPHILHPTSNITSPPHATTEG